MDMTIAIIGSIVLGISLAASSGLRAFLPLFVLGVVGRYTDWVDIGEHFEWLVCGPALLALGIGVALELAGDKIPVVNHILDLIQTPVRTGAGMLISAAVFVDLPMWAVALLAIIVGGGTALAVHTAKSAFRLGANGATAGVVNPLVSVAEDILCFMAALLSVLLWFVAAAVALVGVFVLAVSANAIWRRFRA